MAFKATAQTTEDAFRVARRTAVRLKESTQRTRDLMAAGDVSANVMEQVMGEFVGALQTWGVSKAVPGIADYAKEQYDDPAYDVIAEFNTMETAAEAVRDWVVANFPKDGDGYVLKEKYQADGLIVQRMFTPAQTAGLRTELDAFILTVS